MTTKIETESKQSEIENFKKLVSIVANSNVEVADFLGVSVRTVYRWLSGTTKIPKSAMRALELIAART